MLFYLFAETDDKARDRARDILARIEAGKVAAAMLEYYKLGATSLLIRGYDPLPDAEQYGAELILRV